ncbi:uncharacterized protein [Euwallacea fornicatus]|uniref:uncharacterized protein n=1 Tax=Euwallacea fornicatus TaxID=995702 RepID=UPI00339077FA
MTLPLLDVSSTMIFMRVSTTVALTWCVVFAKVYERCDLVRELRNFDIPNDEIPTWVCIVQHESNYNTSAMNPASGDHGLFQISQIYWCSPPGDGYGCNSACSEFRDDDISDDLQCVRRIYNEHKRISGNGFNAWTVYPLYCKDDLSRYMSNCSEPDVPSQNSTENEISNEQDLDEYGYHFPALPSFPKEQKEESDDEQVFPQLPSNKYSINDSIQVKDEKVTDLLGSSQSLIKDEEQMLPYSKISIHHSVPVTVTRHVIFEKLPYSKQSIHHFTAVTNEKVQKDTKIEDIPSTNTDHVNTEITDERKEAEPVRFGTNSTVPFDVGRGLEPSEISSKTSQAALELENLNDNSKKLLGEISEASANLHEGSATGFKKQPIVSSTNLKISYNSKTLRPLEPTMLPSNIQRRMLNLTQFTETSYMKNATTNNRNFLTSTFSPPSTARDFTSTMNPNAKQLTFAPDSFFSWLFNSQTLPPIVPPVRPSRPPGERPGNSNRPTIFKPVGEGNPGRPRPTISRPVRPDIIPEQTNTTTRRPLRPNNLNRPFPHRRPFYRPSSVSELVGTTTTVRSVAMLNGGVTANNLGRNGGLEAEKGVEIKLNDNVVFLRTKYGYSLVRTSV